MIALFRKRHPELVVARGADRRRVHRLRRTGGCCRSSTRRSWSACSATCSTRTSSSGRTASGRSRAITSIIRSCSRSAHQEYQVQYLPAESNTGMFGGNSNWRGPVWMPVNALIVRALLNLYAFYGDDFKVECPTGSGHVHEPVRGRRGDHATADSARSSATTTAGGPVYGGTAKFQNDPHWRDLILFYEYFHGDNGAGLAPATRPDGPASSRPLARHLRPCRCESPPRTRTRQPAHPRDHRAGDRATGRNVKRPRGAGQTGRPGRVRRRSEPMLAEVPRPRSR